MNKDKVSHPDERELAAAEPAPETQGSAPGEEPVAGSDSRRSRVPAKIKPTRISGTWVAIIVAVIVLVFLLIFILQNSASVTVHYFGLSGTLPLGVALLFAAVGGAVLVALVGAARIVQLRRFARRASSRE